MVQGPWEVQSGSVILGASVQRVETGGGTLCRQCFSSYSYRQRDCRTLETSLAARLVLQNGDGDSGNGSLP